MKRGRQAKLSHLNIPKKKTIHGQSGPSEVYRCGVTNQESQPDDKLGKGHLLFGNKKRFPKLHSLLMRELNAEEVAQISGQRIRKIRKTMAGPEQGLRRLYLQ